MRIFSALFLAALVACSGSESAPEPAPAPAPKAEPAPPPPPPEPEAKAEFDAAGTFGTVCATCHGVGGAGDGVAGAALDPKPANFTEAGFWEGKTDEELHKVIKEGGAAAGKSPMMAPYGGQYDDEQITKLVEHIKTFKPAE